MKKIDTKELVNLITTLNDSDKIKSVASLIVKINNLETEEEKLRAFQERVATLREDISQELNQYRAFAEEKPKSNRGRKKKVVA